LLLDSANLLQCELFPGDFKRVLEMLLRVTEELSRNKRLGLSVTNEGKGQLARLLKLLFQALDRGDIALYAPNDRLRSVVEVVRKASPDSRRLCAALQPHVGPILRLLSSTAHHVSC
jgi:hypothetical protein